VVASGKTGTFHEYRGQWGKRSAGRCVVRVWRMTTSRDDLGNRLRARIETVSTTLADVAAGTGAFSDPVGAYLTISIQIGTLEAVLRQMRVLGLVRFYP
jgi:hypothetical protein